MDSVISAACDAMRETPCQQLTDVAMLPLGHAHIVFEVNSALHFSDYSKT
jgi:hypothetical protein